MYKIALSSEIQNVLSSGRGSFLALSAARHAGGLRVHYSASLGPGQAPWCVLLGVQSRASWQIVKGLCSASISRAGSWQADSFSFALRCRIVTVSHHPSSFQALYFVQPRYNSSRIKLFHLWRPRTVLLCLCVCECVPSSLSSEEVGTQYQTRLN